jgi:hypothetical protein
MLPSMAHLVASDSYTETLGGGYSTSFLEDSNVLLVY